MWNPLWIGFFIDMGQCTIIIEERGGFLRHGMVLATPIFHVSPTREVPIGGYRHIASHPKVIREPSIFHAFGNVIIALLIQ